MWRENDEDMHVAVLRNRDFTWVAWGVELLS